MTKANECTCPSGDGSLRHPCPAHPASVELAGVAANLTFINGRPAMCGCQVEYSSGGGEYSDVIYVTLCAKHSGSAILDLVATNRIALTPEYEGQWHADLYLDREIPLAKAEGATPAEAVLALMSAERIDPEQESVEQAGGDERVIGWRERILAAHPNSDPGFWPDALLVEHMAAEIADLRAALAQPSPAQAEQAEAEAERPEVFGLERYRVERTGQGFWPYCVRAGDGTRELFVGHLKQCKRVAAQLATAFEDGKFVAGALRAELETERMRLAGCGVAALGYFDGCADAYKSASLSDVLRLRADCDAALARVAKLELKLDQSDYSYDNDRHHMRGMAKQAAEAIQVFTGHDSGANLAHRYGDKWWEHLDELRDALLAFAKNAPPAQAQHSVPEGWKLVPSDKGCVTSSMKAECIGEFSFYIRAACAECLDVGTDSDCHVCGGDIEYDQKIDVPWDTCKEIYKTMLAAAPGKAQHSVPEVSGIGRDFAYPRSVVLYLRTEPTDDDLRAILDGLRSLAAAPGKEGV
ncbi:hypothetical protein [Pseudomonas aeruginosa]